ncbi:MAG: OmpA family protein [Acidobacteriota bacterium]
MKPILITIFVSGMCLLTAACSHPKPVAQTPPITTPVAPPPATPKPAPQLAKAAPAPTPPPVAQAKAPVQPPARPAKLDTKQRDDLNLLLTKLSDALFDYNVATIRPDANSVLHENVTVIRNILADYPTEKLLIEGHADDRGSSEYNLALGQRRARSAQEFLTTNGIPAAQLTVVSFGEERPVCTTQDEACWQKNRRAHITVAP